MKYISTTWLTVLACAAGWTTFFSFFNTPGIRGYRNLGLLACYVLGFVMLAVLPWRTALSTWLLLGAATGSFYFAYECSAFLKVKDKTEAPRPSFGTIINGLYL